MAYQDLLNSLNKNSQSPYDDMDGTATQLPVDNTTLSPADMQQSNANITDADLSKEIADLEKSTPMPQPQPPMPEPQSPPMQQPQAPTDDLSQAMEAKRLSLLMSGLARSGAQAGTAIGTRGGTMGKVPLDENSYKTIESMGELPMEKYKADQAAKKAQMEADYARSKMTSEQLQNEYIKAKTDSEKMDIALTSEKQDPHSQVSNFTRNFAKLMGIPKEQIPEDVSAAALEKQFPYIEKYMQSKEMAAQRALLARSGADDKTENRIYKMDADMGKDLDPTHFRAGTLKRNQERIDAAGRIEALYNAAGKNPALINMRELGMSVANMLSTGSQTAVANINELVPHSLAGDATKIQDWFTSEPNGAGQQAFAKMYLKIAQREKEVAQQQIIDAQLKKAFSTHSQYKKLDPNRFYSTLSNATGLSEDDIKQMEEQKFSGKGNQAKSAPSEITVSNDEINKMINNSKLKGIDLSPDQAKQLLMQRKSK